MGSDFGMNKLNNFPKIYCASLIECKDRRKNIQDEFLNYNIAQTVAVHIGTVTQ